MVVSMVVGEGAGIGLCVFRISYLIRVLGFVLFKFGRCVCVLSCGFFVSLLYSLSVSWWCEFLVRVVCA